MELSEVNPGDDDATLSLGDALILAIGERLDGTIITRDTYWTWMGDQGLLGLNIHVPQ